MSGKLKFVWIDDQADRIKDSKNLEKQLGIKCIFLNVQPENVDFLKSIEETKPDLILVDHNLTEIGTGKIKKGSTIAALIREKHPNYAIACITGQPENGIDSQQRQAYEAIFDIDNFKEYYPTMKSIAVSYRKMKTAIPINTLRLFQLMKVHAEDQIRLETILPHDIKENYSDQAIYSKISHWIRGIIMERPGFLYDRLWTATLLGLNESGFKKVEKLFKPAIYSGIFADESKVRWWKSKLLTILNKSVDQSGLPWEKGRFLPNINARNFSKDYYSDYKEGFPEVVAYIDDTKNERAPMKLKYTVPHPKYDKLLFFEDIRMMQAD